MACHVFGTPVTDATLKGMTEYHDKPIRAVDRAKVALEMKNAEGKDVEALKFADSVQESISKKGVRCVIYNATGDSLRLRAVFEYAGCVSESPYPYILQNGQWGSFVHEKESNSTTSIAALVFEDRFRQWVVGWYQRNNEISKCFGEFRHTGFFNMNTSADIAAQLRSRIEGSRFIHEVQSNGDAIISTIGNTPLPVYETILTKNAAL